MATILVIDPSRSMRSTLKDRLEHEGYTVHVAEDTIAGVSMYASTHYDLVLCGQPDSPLRISTPWIRLSHDSSSDAAVMAMQQGAVDFITKPINMNRLLDGIRNGLKNAPKPGAKTDSIEPAVEDLVAKPRSRKAGARVPEMVGESPAMLKLKEIINKVAPTGARVLIMGSNGTGKELVAGWLHEKSRRKEGPFIQVNCAAIPSELIESELFGHEKGAFTSAIKQSKGKFEQADGGTLFLDEIGDMSLAAQAKVLRVLQERKITRVGSDKDITVDVRVIAATNKNVPREIESGSFREDLFHRLSVIIIKVPPLCERLDDIPLMVDCFMQEFCDYYKHPQKSIEKEALDELMKMPWTGNIRELRNVVERLVILCGDTITREDIILYANGLE